MTAATWASRSSAATKGLTEDRTRSHVKEGEKLLAKRAATTEVPNDTVIRSAGTIHRSDSTGPINPRSLRSRRDVGQPPSMNKALPNSMEFPVVITVSTVYFKVVLATKGPTVHIP